MLRDCMRRHGIPSDWIECRILSVTTTSNRPGLHVHFIVRDGVDRLLTYVPAFQGSFMEEITRFDSRVRDWLLSVSWQFENFNGISTSMPDPGVWGGRTVPAPLAPIPAVTAAPVATAAPAPAPTRPPVPTPRPTQAPPPATTPAPRPAAAPTPQAAASDAEVMEDLQALFAIRDAAIRQRPLDQPDFEPTRPGGEDGTETPPDQRQPRRW
jgi:hypothetical protein